MQRKSSKDTGPMLPGMETCESATGPLWRTPSSAVTEAKSSVKKLTGRTPDDPQVGLPDQVAAGYSPPLTSSAGAFLAKTSVWQAGVRALRALVRGCGLSSLDSLAKLDPDGSWLKMCQGYSQLTMEGDLERYSGTWPRSGTMRSGIVYPLAPLAPLTDVIASLSSDTVPTPRAGQESEGRGDLLGMVRGWPAAARHNPGMGAMWPTPRNCSAMAATITESADADRYPNLETVLKKRDPSVVGGQLNPEWVTWLMGFPPGWVDTGEPNPPSVESQPACPTE